MLFALYNEDGSIHQANKVYEPEGYDKLLLDRGHTFVAANFPGPVSPEHWFVNVKAQEICERPPMQVEVSKTRIRCGNSDFALLKNCPLGATFTISTGGVAVHSGLLDGTDLELYIPVPCVYRVVLDLWPYKTFTVEIEAVAS